MVPILDIACLELAWFNELSMPHLRQRHILPLLLQKLKFSPVVTVQGARQTGKSLLVRDILCDSLPSLKYTSFDQFKTLDFAQSNPGSFLAQYSAAHPLAIDEAQKVPKIFDEIKYEVDQRRTPGRYILLGSTEFSKMTLVRESLTGRMSRIRLFSMNLAETFELPANPSKSFTLMNDSPRINRSQFLQYLEKGGMPGIFAIRNNGERETFLQDWLDLTIQRDAMLIPKIKLDIELCRRILESIATLEEPDAGTIANTLKKDLRRIKTHLTALETLFVVHTLSPHPLGTGKPLYFLCDVSFAKILGANFETQLYTWLVQEQMSQRAYRDDRKSSLYYYRTSKGSRIHLLVEDRTSKKLAAIKLISEEKTNSKTFEILHAFKKKTTDFEISLWALGAARMSLKTDQIEVYPWESIA